MVKQHLGASQQQSWSEDPGVKVLEERFRTINSDTYNSMLLFFLFYLFIFSLITATLIYLHLFLFRECLNFQSCKAHWVAVYMKCAITPKLLMLNTILRQICDCFSYTGLKTSCQITQHKNIFLKPHNHCWNGRGKYKKNNKKRRIK